jgi:hypothetical protein
MAALSCNFSVNLKLVQENILTKNITNLGNGSPKGKQFNLECFPVPKLFWYQIVFKKTLVK